ncbi:MAG TPA: hypothetical protein VMG74_10600 [Gaiellaceae bacterium]|nr:hypothetical protein [Gaiellaceae bacterium]HUJ54548.1 hypothetical protein [Gaiellaceae bacterium]
MIWLGWRQQRVEAAIAAAMLVVLAAVAIPVGVHMASVYSHEHLSVCADNTQPGACSPLVSSFLLRFGSVNMLFVWATLLPALAGLLFAAPYVLDIDSGTYRLFWTQSITRRRWIVSKLTMGVVASVAVALCLTALAMWSLAPLDHLNGRLSNNNYDAEGIVPIAYALLVLGLGVALGALWRRTVPALLVAFVAYVVGRAFMDSWLRQRLLTPVRTTWPGSAPGPNLNQALVIDQFTSDKHGHRIAGGGPCVRTSGGSGGLFTHTSSCAQRHAPGAHVYTTAVYQPASRFWELQGIEFAIVAGIGLLLVVFAGWWTHRRLA